ncbi:MAG: hypothetical protein QXX64_06330 [Nitrososphaera sp.]|uniref:Uncharacterized protein n=1 Tax=Nitrososphaera gargensis (strain Ga9.2) TaxID=1237085 RepID=K0I8Y6_NITGG|nr:hypothetical protein [Candidatus Nitrososphaera gargensis]AFU57721.1 hypothetical protein Ngar_c07790 [Candidatus Nitrososphaera gargensis Ga9.2]
MTGTAKIVYREAKERGHVSPLSLMSNINLIHANFFFMDIVGLSDPYISTRTQIKKIETLNKSIMECDAFKSTPKEMMLVLPTGDVYGSDLCVERFVQQSVSLGGESAQSNRPVISTAIMYGTNLKSTSNNCHNAGEHEIPNH